MIYVIRDALSGHVKIGTSKNPWSRYSKMRVDCPGEVSMRAIIPGDRAEEQALHCRFADHRLRGEWFRCDGPLAEWLLGLPLADGPSPGERYTWGDSGITDDALALVVGISRAHLSKVRRGKTMPSLKLGLDIVQATGVDIRSLLQAQPKRKARVA